MSLKNLKNIKRYESLAKLLIFLATIDSKKFIQNRFRMKNRSVFINIQILLLPLPCPKSTGTLPKKIWKREKLKRKMQRKFQTQKNNHPVIFQTHHILQYYSMEIYEKLNIGNSFHIAVGFVPQLLKETSVFNFRKVLHFLKFFYKI